MEQESQAAAPAGTNSSAPNASAQNVPAPAASTIPQCEKPGGMGLSRGSSRSTPPGAPDLGFQHFKQYDFLHDKEVVLTFDDGPWPSTPAVLKALTDECLKATFFEIGEHATLISRNHQTGDRCRNDRRHRIQLAFRLDRRSTETGR